MAGSAEVRFNAYWANGEQGRVFGKTNDVDILSTVGSMPVELLSVIFSSTLDLID